ncbi:SIR2 family protein [Polaromonas aquatica]|uniref:SIR2 family protein n=1 Tax=Polaromonas aquatica TaxID=332657 RepID=UPI003D661E7C
MKSFEHGVEELLKLLELSKQHWLLGAGASVESGIPLMYPLTARVKACLVGQEAVIFQSIMDDLSLEAHVEHALSHLGDLIALAERSRLKTVTIAAANIPLADLEATYKAVIQAIATTVRYGYRAATGGAAEVIGTHLVPLVDVDAHQRFVRQLFKAHSNLEARSKVGFITTNYDTLLEDALAMEQRIALDGFSGGAIAFWNGINIDPGQANSARSHQVLKLHGSVDWFRDAEVDLLRVRYGVKYLADLSSTLIYPQATKYLETQKDPFARIFDCFRKTLRSSDSNLLAIVGYSFGDDHINSEIESALADRRNKTTLIAFSKEVLTAPGAVDTTPCGTLMRWANDSRFGSRIYVATDKALYNGTAKAGPNPAKSLDWWTFAGLTNFLEQGAMT